MTTLQLITSTHTTTHNTLQASIAVEDTYDYYYATDDFMDGLISEIKAQGSVFAALRMINEINRLNGYKVVSDYHTREIKNHFSYNENRKNGFSNNKREMSQRESEYQNWEGIKGKQNDQFIKEYQKAYMRMLSI